MWARNESRQITYYVTSRNRYNKRGSRINECMLCILRCKGTIDDNFTLAGNEEDSTNHEDIDIQLTLVLANPEGTEQFSLL